MMETGTRDIFVRRLGEMSSDGVVCIDPSDTSFTYANPVISEMTGLSEQALCANPHALIARVPPEDIDYARQRYHAFLASRECDPIEIRLIRDDGTFTYLSCELRWETESGQVIIFAKDISRLKFHEEYTLKYTVQKDTLLDMLIHNLSGPLRVSRDILGILKEKMSAGGGEDPERILHLLRINTEQCIDIVNDFLREEHFESMRTTVKKSRFNVSEKVEITLEKLRQLNADKTFSLKCRPELQINTDPVKFLQVMHNLLSNAIKYTSEGGSISVTVDETGEHTLRVTVTDTGIGIPDELQKKILQHNGPGRTGLKGEKSSGIGISIVQKLLLKLDGQLSFSSMENEGSAFTITLPKELVEK
jgi:two-component system sensor histidine kinase VicK